jgi:putative transposase
VIMPDHFHLILAVIGSKSLSDIMKSIDQFTANKINKKVHQAGPFWEEGFYDRAIRNRKDYESRIKYIHENPVKSGFCESPEEYIFSSANSKYSNLVDLDWFL